MNLQIYFFLALLFIVANPQLNAQNCDATDAASFAACAADPATTSITITASNADIVVSSPADIDLRGITVSLGNSSITLPEGTQVDTGTSFDAGGNDGVSVTVGTNAYFFNANGGGSPTPDGTLAELNAAIAGGATTLGEAAEIVAGVLPVSLLSFEARAMDKKVVLTWVVAEESANESFELSFSSDGTSFQPLRTVAGRGDATGEHTYEISDFPSVSGNVYYRLSQRDFSGATRELGVRSVRWEANSTSDLSVFPNPGIAGQMVQLQGIETATSVDLLGMNGQLVRQLNISNGQLMVPGELTAGVYLLRIAGKKLTPVRFVVK